MDLKIPNVEGLSISASYFHINFRNRIASPLSGDLLPAGAGQGPYSKYVAWDPSVEQISMWTESPYFFLQEGQDPSQVDVIVDNRLKNIAATHVSGVDASVVYEWSVRGVRVNGVLNGEYLAHHEQQVLAGEQVVSLRNTVFNPVARRARGGFTAERGGMAGGVFANYVDGYEDNRQAVNVGVGAMTTVDMSLSYSVGKVRNAAAALENVTVGLNVFNVLNQRPPYVWDRVNHVNYDGANASALGRVVAVRVGKKW
jgi:outer membrane receptor protein involved in Fe transport